MGTTCRDAGGDRDVVVEDVVHRGSVVVGVG